MPPRWPRFGGDTQATGSLEPDDEPTLYRPDPGDARDPARDAQFPRHRPARAGGTGHPRRHVGASEGDPARSEEHTSELQSLMRISYAVFCLKKKKKQN